MGQHPAPTFRNDGYVNSFPFSPIIRCQAPRHRTDPTSPPPLVLAIPVIIFSYIPMHGGERKAFVFVFALGMCTVGAGIAGSALRIDSQITNIKRDPTEPDDIAFILEVRTRVARVQLAYVAEICCATLVLVMPFLRVLVRGWSRNGNGGRSLVTEYPLQQQQGRLGSCSLERQQLGIIPPTRRQSFDSYVSLPASKAGAEEGGRSSPSRLTPSALSNRESFMELPVVVRAAWWPQSKPGETNLSAG